MDTLLSPVFAQLLNTANVKAPTQLNFATIISFAINALIVVAGVIFLIMLLVGGLRWILSGGDKASAEAARGQVTAALIGLVIVFAAWAIGNVLASIFGINIFQLALPAANGGNATF